MMANRWVVAGYLALVFGSGAAVGAMGHRLYMVSTVIAKNPQQSPDEWRQKYMEEMKARLKLRDEQILRLNILLDETRSRVREAQGRLRPEIDQIRHEHSAKVAEMLDPSQRVEYEKLRKEREERAERERQTLEQQEKERSTAPPQQPQSDIE